MLSITPFFRWGRWGSKRLWHLPLSRIHRVWSQDPPACPGLGSAPAAPWPQPAPGPGTWAGVPCSPASLCPAAAWPGSGQCWSAPAVCVAPPPGAGSPHCPGREGEGKPERGRARITEVQTRWACPPLSDPGMQPPTSLTAPSEAPGTQAHSCLLMRWWTSLL